MAKKFSWEVDKTSLILRVTDGAKETTWKFRKNTAIEVLRTSFEEIQLAMWDGYPMRETVRTVDQAELDALREAYNPIGEISTDATSEEASKAALQARVDKLSNGAKWWPEDEDESIAFLPDYDAGEI